MRRIACPLALALLASACEGPAAPPPPPGTQTYAFGPYEIAPGEEIEDACVQITLDNPGYLYINTVELTTGPGFHHSNWLFVPEHVFPGEDGTYTCNDRGYNEAIAAVFGGVLFAQSTQAPHEIQAFLDGVAVRLPPRTKLVAQIHLLNATDDPLTVAPTIALTAIEEPRVSTVLAGISFENKALALPPNRASRFSIECDIAEGHQRILGRAPDFNIYYALAHYHDLATGLAVEAVRADGSVTTIYTTQGNVGDTLGGPIAPPFSMTGYTKLRMVCDFYNPRATPVYWGVGDQEMCVFLAFSDSDYNWAGGVVDRVPPQREMQVGDALHYDNDCQVFATDARH